MNRYCPLRDSFHLLGPCNISRLPQTFCQMSFCSHIDHCRKHCIDCLLLRDKDSKMHQHFVLISIFQKSSFPSTWQFQTPKIVKVNLKLEWWKIKKNNDISVMMLQKRYTWWIMYFSLLYLFECRRFGIAMMKECNDSKEDANQWNLSNHFCFCFNFSRVQKQQMFNYQVLCCLGYTTLFSHDTRHNK